MSEIKMREIETADEAVAAFQLLKLWNNDVEGPKSALTGNVAVVPDMPPTAAGFVAYEMRSSEGELAYIAEPTVSNDLAIYWTFSFEDLQLAIGL